jgi:hypothetical protein
VSTDHDNAYKSVTEDRWEKTKKRTGWFAFQGGLTDADSTRLLNLGDLEKERVGAPKGHMLHKMTESYRGFLVYVSRTYRVMVPYLKRIHLSLDRWRENRDEDGWRIANVYEKRLECEERKKPQKWTPMVPRFKDDVWALMHSTKDALLRPPVPIRPTNTAAVFMVGDDASRSGFGTSSWSQNSEELTVQFGAWDVETSKESSNFREAYNLVLRVEHMVARGELMEGLELFVFTDNFVSGRAFYNGSSKSKRLHALVMRLRKLEMEGNIVVHMVWFAGTRMKEQGTDGLSIGDLTGGVMVGNRFLKHIPLNKTVLERAPEFKKEFEKGLPGKGWRWLDYEDWFEGAFDDDHGLYVWTPPPTLADVAMEQMCEVKHVHHHISHVFLCHALMTARWRKQMLKASDMCVSLLQGSPAWIAKQHEPVVCALIGPLRSCRLWRIKNHFWVEEWRSKVPWMWRQGGPTWRDHTRKFWLRALSRTGRCKGAWHGVC